MKPLLLDPPIKDYIWGGTKLREQFGKKSNLERLAESWELSCHKDGQSVIADGEYAGKTLAEFLEENPQALGNNCSSSDDFPIMVKLIDARDNLSVQVHPDDEYAHRNEGDNGKTEMWYVVDCDEGAELIYGFKEKITKDEFRRAIEENTLLDYVNRVPVKKGDVFFIKPGTLHAIGRGILIAEIQQSSNVTYRVYDYGRLGDDGKPRELHIEKALEVTDLNPTEPYKPEEAFRLFGPVQQKLAICDYFQVMKFDFIYENDKLCIGRDTDDFRHVLVVDGTGQLVCGEEIIPLKKGLSVFIPAGAETCEIKGKCSIIITTVIKGGF